MTSTMLFQPCKVVDNSVSNSPEHNHLSLYHQGYFRKEPSVSAFTCTFYYHTYMYTHVISCDGQSFTLLSYEISHIMYRKFNTGLSNKLAFQRKCSIDRFLPLITKGPWHGHSGTLSWNSTVMLC